MRFDPDATLAKIRDDLSGVENFQECRSCRDCRKGDLEISNKEKNNIETIPPNETSNLNVGSATTATIHKKHPSIKIIRKIQDAFAAFERSCPERIPTEVWRQTVADGRKFMDE